MSECQRYAIFDADNHEYEPLDCLTRHIEAKYRLGLSWDSPAERRTYE